MAGREKDEKEIKGVNLLGYSRILGTVNALIVAARHQEDSLQLREMRREIKIGSHSFTEISRAAVFPEFDFVRGVKMEYVPGQDEEFQEGEKRIANACLVAGNDRFIS